MSVLRSVAVAVPSNRYDTLELREAGLSWLGDSSDQLKLFERFMQSVKPKQRHFALPIPKLLALNGQKERSDLFSSHAVSISQVAVTKALSNLDAQEAAQMIFSSCTVPTIPAIDVHLVERLGLSPNIRRVPLYQHGCAGGMVGLALANQLSTLGGRTLLLSAELCSLVFHSEDQSRSSVLAAALFADGAACAVIDQAGEGLAFMGSASYLIPESAHVMGYNILDSGTYLRLERELPQILALHMPKFVEQFLAEHNLQVSDVAWWLFHPGGTKILKVLEEALELSRAQTFWAWDVLSQYGNMSSATILFVLSGFLKDRPFKSGDLVMTAGVGPGLTLELTLFACNASSC